jgi:hypothetical protein
MLHLKDGSIEWLTDLAAVHTMLCAPLLFCQLRLSQHAPKSSRIPSLFNWICLWLQRLGPGAHYLDMISKPLNSSCYLRITSLLLVMSVVLKSLKRLMST